MKILGVDIEYFIDYLNKSIHILDEQRHGTGISNVICPHWMKNFIEHETLLQDIYDFDWYCYSGGGIVGRYYDYHFILVDINDPKLHNPFAVIAKERRNKSYGR